MEILKNNLILLRQKNKFRTFDRRTETNRNVKRKIKIIKYFENSILFIKLKYIIKCLIIMIIQLILTCSSLISSLILKLSSSLIESTTSTSNMLFFTTFITFITTSMVNADHNSISKQAANILTQSAPTNTGCPPTADAACLRCNIEGCIKCPDLLIQDTRQCINDTCPSGYIQQWSSLPDIMGKICIPHGMSTPLLAVITGLISGCLICFSCLMIAVVLIKRKRRKSAIKKKLIQETTMDRSDFLRQLEDMRPNAEYFLAMLNDTRRQIRKLYLSGEIEAANTYRPVIRDLAKILILLNRPIELIPAPPPDWNHIYTWAEQSLEKYKPKIGQLIDFLQAPSAQTGNHNGDDYYDGGSQQFSDNYGGSYNGGTNGDLRAYHLHQNHQLLRNKNFQLFGSLISLHELENNTRSADPFGSNFNTLRTGVGLGGGVGGINLITDLNASSLWLEDEFFRLGFRPQDEITTEL